MSEQQAPQSSLKEPKDSRRTGRRKRSEPYTAKDFALGSIIRVLLKSTWGHEIPFQAVVVESLYHKANGRTFDHVIVQIYPLPTSAAHDYGRDHILVHTILKGKLFLLDYDRGNYWYWKPNIVKWVPPT